MRADESVEAGLENSQNYVSTVENTYKCLLKIKAGDPRNRP